MSLQHTSKAGTIGVLDVLGVGASSLCAVHCLLTPFIIAFLPALGVQFLCNDTTHRLLASWVVFFCLSAIVPGYCRHKRSSVLSLMTAGLALVLFATFLAAPTLGATWEVPLITCGNLSLIAAHLINRKLACAAHHHH